MNLNLTHLDRVLKLLAEAKRHTPLGHPARRPIDEAQQTINRRLGERTWTIERRIQHSKRMKAVCAARRARKGHQ